MPGEPIAPLLRQLRRLRPTKQSTDASLLGFFIARRDEAAFAELVERHGTMVFQVCRRLLGQQQDAEDAFQATFLTLARAAPSIRRRQSLASWLHGVAHRTSLAMYRSNARRVRREAVARSAATASPVAQLVWHEVQAILESEIERLPENYRSVFIMCYLEGRSRVEVARELEIKEGTISSRLDQARKRLRERLRQRGISLTAALGAVALTQESVQAAVSLSLLSQTVRAAVAYAVDASALGTVSAEVAGIVIATGKGVVSMKLVPMIAITVLVASLAAGVACFGPTFTKLPQDEQAKRAKLEAVPSAEAKRVDQYGDPLPSGALARLGTVRFRAGGEVSAVTFLADGQTLVSTGHKGIHFWEAATGKKIRTFEAPGGGAWHFALSPDGRTLAASCYDRATHVWEVATGKELHKLSSHGSLAFSHGGDYLAIGSYGALSTWDLTKGKQHLNMSTPPGDPKTIAFSADDQSLIVVDSQHHVRVWELSSQRLLREIKCDEISVYVSHALSADGTLMATTRRDKIHFWDIATGKELRSFDNPGDLVVAISPDRRMLVSRKLHLTLDEEESRTTLWDLATGKAVLQLPVSGRSGQSAAFSPDGKTLALGGGHEGIIRLFDVTTGKPLQHQEGHESGVGRLAFSPDGTLVATRSHSDHTIRLWDVRTGKERHRLGGPPNYGYTLAFAPDGKSLAAGDWQGYVRFWDPVSGRDLRSWLVDKNCRTIHALAFSPNGRTLTTVSYKVASVNDGNSVLIATWDAATGKSLGQHHGQVGGFMIGEVCLSPDGSVLLWPEGADGIVVQDSSKGRKLANLQSVPRYRLTRRAFSPDNRLLAAITYEPVTRGQSQSAENYTLRLWETASGKECFSIVTKDRHVDGLGFSPDGRAVAWGCPEAIRVWDVTTGKELVCFQGHDVPIGAFAFAPDGKTLASGQADSTALLWDLQPYVRRAEQPLNDLKQSDLLSLWSDLAADDAGTARRAIWRLVAGAKPAVPFLAENARPAVEVDAKRVAELIATLESEKFSERERATAELAKLGEAAEPALEKLIAGQPSAEARRRAAKLLAEVSSVVTDRELLRILRAIEVLEHIGSPEARQILGKLAAGAPGARVTEDAKGSVERLQRLSASPP
jgi:RNA polymerase sigma factor (sigma-70 family)